MKKTTSTFPYQNSIRFYIRSLAFIENHGFVCFICISKWPLRANTRYDLLIASYHFYSKFILRSTFSYFVFQAKWIQATLTRLKVSPVHGSLCLLDQFFSLHHRNRIGTANFPGRNHIRITVSIPLHRLTPFTQCQRTLWATPSTIFNYDLKVWSCCLGFENKIKDISIPRHRIFLLSLFKLLIQNLLRLLFLFLPNLEDR